MAATLRHQASISGSASAHSPTSSASSRNTTPTSPHFLHAQAAGSRYASGHAYTSPFPHDARPGTSLSIHHPRPPTPPLLQPPAQFTSFSAYVRTWGNSEIAAFLALHRCGHYASAFQRNDIDGRVLLDLDMTSLKDMGVAKVGERVKLLGGIKDLRKRASTISSASFASTDYPSQGSSISHGIELRLNGAATPDPDSRGPRSPDIRLLTERSILSSQDKSRRLNSTRPPPLDLQPHQSSRPLPMAYQNTQPPPGSAQSATHATTPRPKLTHVSSSSTTTTPANNSLGQSKSNINLRAPPSREGVRRSPSPVNVDAVSFADRPLPPAPNAQQSSAAEYANAITLQRHATEGRGTPSDHRTVSANTASGSRSNTLSAAKIEHRKQSSLGTTPTKQLSPIKSKFSQFVGGRPSASGGPIHPFAANASREDKPLHGTSTTPSSHRRNLTSGHADSPQPAKNSLSDSRHRKDASASHAQLPLEDIRRQVVKFINHEDGSTRTVNVSECTSGVEVLERVLKKFGKWHTMNNHSTDGESDDEGDRLEVDGWGIYAESDPEDDGTPMIGMITTTNVQPNLSQTQNSWASASRIETGSLSVKRDWCSSESPNRSTARTWRSSLARPRLRPCLLPPLLI